MLKKLMEQRAGLKAELDAILALVKTEERAMTDEENTKFEDLEKQIKDLDKTIAAEKRARDLELNEEPAPAEQRTAEEQEAAEVRAFDAYLRDLVEQRTDPTDVNMTKGANGAVIPASIANKIITKVADISPLYGMATRYNVGGTLTIPKYVEGTGSTITVDYASEFEDLLSTSGAFQSVTLQSFLGGALTKISRSLINNSSFDLVNYVIDRMAEAIAKWLDKEIINGTTNKIRGIADATQTVTAGAKTFLTGDDLINLQEAIPDAYQSQCIWVMNKATRTAIRKLKDKDDNYLLNRDMTARWGYTLLGAPVYCSDASPVMGTAGNAAVAYLDPSGLAVKLAEDLEIEVLRERFATQHVVGVVGWIDVDAKIENEQKVALLKAAAADPQA